jgi:repressor of nif and glnA expression
MTEAKKERYRRIRGALLKLLAKQHPGPLDIKEVHFLLDDMGYPITEEELRSHLSYLAEGKLIIHNKRKSGGVEIEMIVISRDGLNVLDEFVKDVGIDTRF